jgi:transmembrane sensor
MSLSGETKDNTIPPERLAEAGVWIARLHGDERDRDLEEAVRQWLQANPLNARAFELATEVWDDAANLRRLMPLGVNNPVRRTHFPVALAATIAMALAVLTMLALYLYPDGVTTAVGEQRMLTLSDGTRVYLNTATHIVVHYDRHSRRVELETGEALFDVAKATDRPFMVTAGDRQVTALGTSFVVRRDDQRLAVTLVEGKVTVNQTFTLTPGERLTLTPGEAARFDMPSLEKATAWRRGQVILDDTPLAAAVAEMNRYSPIKLVIEQHEADSLLISGLFQAGDSASFARAVAATYGLAAVNKGDRIVLAGVPRDTGRATPAEDSGLLHL